MFKRKLIVLTCVLSSFSLFARLQIINNSGEDVDIYTGYSGWKQTAGPFTVKAGSKPFIKDMGTVAVGGLTGRTKTQQINPVYANKQDPTFTYDNITGTITKDAKGALQLTVDNK
jgi:hypothetical protein